MESKRIIFGVPKTQDPPVLPRPRLSTDDRQAAERGPFNEEGQVMPIESHERNEQEPDAEEVMPMGPGRGDDAIADERATEDEGDLVGDLWSEDGGSFKPEDTEEEREDGQDDEEKEDEEGNERVITC